MTHYRDMRAEVYDADTGMFCRVPMTSIKHLPVQSVKQYRICRQFRDRGVCASGKSCSCAHVPASVLGANKRENVHMDTTMVPRIRAQCHDAGTRVHVARDDDGGKLDTFDSGDILITRGSELLMAAANGGGADERKRESQQCSHFRRHHVCHRGSRCYFIHVLPEAKHFDDQGSEGVSDDAERLSNDSHSSPMTPKMPDELTTSVHFTTDAPPAYADTPAVVKVVYQHNPYCVVSSRVYIYSH